jgi:hypothetical protein
MTTQTTSNLSINLPHEDRLQDDILPQEDQRPKTHFQLQIIRQTSRSPFTENITINPFRLLEIHNQLMVLEGQLSQLTDKVATIVNEIRNMTHQR